MEFAIVDIETTGNHHHDHCITEIGIVVTDGLKIIEEYTTLINPQCPIPFFISRLTGITDEMVADAPLFEEVAGEIAGILDNRVFVAHNVSFDHTIVKLAIESKGLSIPSKRLCTIRLSRAIIPGYKSYGLGKITKTLGIEHTGAHRAMSDAMATANLFHLLFEKNSAFIFGSLKQSSKEAILPANLPKEVFERLPSSTGVYYCHDAKGKIIYIGKAKNIRKRIQSHFTGKNTLNKGGFTEDICDISYELTGNEIIASLLEEAEIKHHWPQYNKAQKAKVYRYGVYQYSDNAGNIRLGVNKINHQYSGIMQFPSQAAARSWLFENIEEFLLNPTLCGMEAFDTGAISYEDHAINIERFLKAFLAFEQTLLWHGRGRKFGEISFVLMERGIYKGFGFVDDAESISNLERLKDFLQVQHETIHARRILKSDKMKALKKIEINETFLQEMT